MQSTVAAIDSSACWIINMHLHINQAFCSIIAIFQSVRNGITVAGGMAHARSDHYLYIIFGKV